MAPEHLRLLRRRGIETVILAGADTAGIMRGKRVAVAELEPVPPSAGRGGYFPRATLAEATDRLERSALARDWLGDDVVEHGVALRRSELAAPAATVSDWETSRYLGAL